MAAQRPHWSFKLLFFDADCLDLLFSVSLGLEGGWPNLNPGRFSRLRFDDFALLRRFLLDDVIVGARRRYQQPCGGRRQSQFLQH